MKALKDVVLAVSRSTMLNMQCQVICHQFAVNTRFGMLSTRPTSLNIVQQFGDIRMYSTKRILNHTVRTSGVVIYRCVFPELTQIIRKPHEDDGRKLGSMPF